MAELICKENCCGCGACYNICPKGAINMIKADDGFLYPQIDKLKCVNCKLCLKVCPALEYYNNNYDMPVFYSAANSNFAIRKSSSSGGIFSIFADMIFEEKGVVFGAVFDNNLYLSHGCAKNKDELIKFRGSKYLQSDIGRSFQLAKDYLKQGIKVLFCGTPCQIAGLKKYINNEYHNLLTVDLVCHGVPSPGLFEDFLEQSCKKNNISKSDIYDIKFRGKGRCYKPSEMYYYYYNKDNRCLYKSNFWQETYGKAFGANLILRESCYNCKFSSFPRIADISIGDFWGVNNFDKNINDNLGISIISINNSKGQYYFDKIKKSLIYCKQVDPISATKFNPNFYIPSYKNENRNDFFANYNKNKDFDEVVNFYLNNIEVKQHGVGILCFTYDNRNYGANMVPFAMCNIVKKMGYAPKIINFYPYLSPNGLNKYSLLAAIKFRENFVELTPKIKNVALLKNLNEQFSTFIVGSDQVWNIKNTKDYTFSYYLDFVATRKNIIAYAASFGSDDFKGGKLITNKIKKLLKRFDSISVREDNGVDLIHKFFSEKIKCTSVLDPTLLVDRDEYEKIIKSEDIHVAQENYVGYYLLSNDNKKTKKFNKVNLEKISKNLNLPLINIRGKDIEFLGKNIFKYSSYPQWLSNIKHASFIITDSFHGVCFSIIFKKNFAYINNVGGISRINSLLSKLNLEDRIYKSFDELDIISLYNKNINYDEVYKKLKIFQQESLNFLKIALDRVKNPEFLRNKAQLESYEKLHENFFDKFDEKVNNFLNYFYYYKRLIKWGVYLYLNSLDLKFISKLFKNH